MSLSPLQVRLVKAAQRAAKLSEADYHTALAAAARLPGCCSSKDPRLGDTEFDSLLSYLEAIYWRKVHRGEDVAARARVFRVEGYWRRKNTRNHNSRDRYAEDNLKARLARAENALLAAGKDPHYLRAIRHRVGTDRGYLAALERTLSYQPPRNPHTSYLTPLP